MITEDNAVTTGAIAAEVGIPRVFAEVLLSQDFDHTELAAPFMALSSVYVTTNSLLMKISKLK